MTAAAPLKWRTDFDKFVVTSNFDRRGWWRWDPGDGDDWNVFWANVHTVKQIFDPSNGIRLGEHQIVNHFPNHYELTRKDLMVKNMRRYRKELEKEARERGDDASCVPDFVPLTFSLPADYSLFVEEFRRVPHATWIVKPTGKAQGKGIFLVNKLAQVKRWATGLHAPGVGARAPSQASREEAHVVSRYVTDPLLVGGKKFDLRIYVVVTSYRPLRAYISRLGFARFCNVKYEDASDNLGNVYAHLTNVAIQKRGEEYNAAHGNKWSLANLRLYLESTRGREATDELFADINDAIEHSLRSVQNVIINDRRCFELYGYDLLVDESMKPWLIEVNASPSLSATTEADRALKNRVIHDALAVAVYPGRLTENGRGSSAKRRSAAPPWTSAGGVPPTVAGTLDVLCDDAAAARETERRANARGTRRTRTETRR